MGNESRYIHVELAKKLVPWKYLHTFKTEFKVRLTIKKKQKWLPRLAAEERTKFGIV